MPELSPAQFAKPALVHSVGPGQSNALCGSRVVRHSMGKAGEVCPECRVRETPGGKYNHYSDELNPEWRALFPDA